jgi:hypothetical protein
VLTPSSRPEPHVASTGITLRGFVGMTLPRLWGTYDLQAAAQTA